MASQDIQAMFRFKDSGEKNTFPPVGHIASCNVEIDRASKVPFLRRVSCHITPTQLGQRYFSRFLMYGVYESPTLDIFNSLEGVHDITDQRLVYIDR